MMLFRVQSKVDMEDGVERSGMDSFRGGTSFNFLFYSFPFVVQQTNRIKFLYFLFQREIERAGVYENIMVNWLLDKMVR